MQNLSLCMMPAPEKPLEPSDARAWLDDWRADWMSAAGAGYASEDTKVRDAFAMLSSDVSTYTGACIAAAITRKPVTLTRYAGPEDPDFADHAAALALVVSGRGLVDGTGGFEDCFELLAEELSRRVANLAERRIA